MLGSGHASAATRKELQKTRRDLQAQREILRDSLKQRTNPSESPSNFCATGKTSLLEWGGLGIGIHSAYKRRELELASGHEEIRIGWKLQRPISPLKINALTIAG